MEIISKDAFCLVCSMSVNPYYSIMEKCGKFYGNWPKVSEYFTEIS